MVKSAMLNSIRKPVPAWHRSITGSFVVPEIS